MTARVIENISSGQLRLVIVVLIIIQFLCFLLGGLIAPSPSSTMSVLGTKCIDKNYSRDKWYWVRGKQKCQSIMDYSDPVIQEQHITANNIVFAFQVPLPKNGLALDYSRWQQNLIATLYLDFLHNENVQVEPGETITIDARLGYKNKGDADNKWSEYAASVEQRNLNCDVDPEKRKTNHLYQCSLVPLFELGSLHHDYYLLNVQIPVRTNEEADEAPINDELPEITDMWVYFTHQNGGFTKVWTSLECIFFVAILAMMFWFRRRISQLHRRPVLLESVILTLSVALSILNCPLEYLSLYFDCPWLAVVKDIRKDLVYAMLLFFWLFLAGVHKDNAEGFQMKINMSHLCIIPVSFVCLLVKDLSKGGFQLYNVFHPIYASEYLKNVSQGFTVVAAVCAIGYLLLLMYMTWKAFKNMSSKQDSLPVYTSKLKFLLLVSLFCAVWTVIGFIIEQFCEGQWVGSKDIKYEYISFLLTGVYGNWNVYTFLVLFLFAPSSERDFEIFDILLSKTNW